MVNSYYWNANQYRNLILNSPMVVYTSENAVSAERKVATVGEFDWIPVPFRVLVVTADQSFHFRFCFQNVDC